MPPLPLENNLFFLSSEVFDGVVLLRHPGCASLPPSSVPAPGARAYFRMAIPYTRFQCESVVNTSTRSLVITHKSDWNVAALMGAGVHFRSSRWKRTKEEEAWDFIAWIVVGLIAGWLAGQVMKGGGYGVLVDIILGILGGFVGGWIFGLLGIWPGGGMIGSIIVAFVGAVILVWISRLIKKA